MNAGIAKERGATARPYRICANCIMDTSDPNITFDERGWCDYCRNYHENVLPNWHPDETGERIIAPVIDKIRKEGKGRDFDCIIGLSGGPDSSYAAYVAKEKFGLRPMLFHVDAGWNTQQAVNNIEKLIDGLDLELYTEVINWEEMRDLQVAFLRAQVPDQDYPQDMAFFSAMYKYARKHKIKHIITGSNISTECAREPEEWGAYVGIDRRLVMDIHGRFGKVPLRSFPIVDIFEYKVYYRYVLGQSVVKILDHVPYRKRDAEEELAKRFGWERFVHKHHESRFTVFFECYWLPRKFGYDKRRAHFTSLILTKQMTRDEALDRISRPEVDEQTLEQEFEYVAKKLDLSVDELRAIFNGPNRAMTDYKNKRFLIGIGAQAMRLLGLERKYFR
jgi:N-acetyl sugar amidotransferase